MFHGSKNRIPRRTDLWPRLWRRQPIVIPVAVLLGVLWFWQRDRVPPGPDQTRYHDRTFTCVKVVDGDTIDIDIPDRKYRTTRIRLWGVDTPETAKSPRGAMYYGSEASAFTRTCVADKPVRLRLDPHQTRDKYGRLLAYVYFDQPEKMLNEELVTQGYAYADPRFEHAWRSRFLDLEKRARQHKIGLWANVKPDQVPYWRQERKTRSTSGLTTHPP